VVEARVEVGEAVAGAIGPGLCVLLGVARGDGEEEDGRFDHSLLDVGGAALVVSQFTLIADTAKGNRPSFSGAAEPMDAERLYERFCAALRVEGVAVETGVFGARMRVALVNDGPVTIVLG
jgi:D-tyrosyl-tRNA(Tyr) deacylase